MSLIVEFTRPHPLVYGKQKFKKYGTVKRAGNRVQVNFESIDGKYVVHFAESDSGQAFVWLTQVHPESGSEGRMDFKQFKRFKQAVQYMKDRFGISLSGMKSFMQQNPNQPKWYWRGM